MIYETSKQMFLDVWQKHGNKKEIINKEEIYNFLNDIVANSKGCVIVDHFSHINFDRIERVEHRTPYTFIYWKDFSEFRERYFNDGLSQFEGFEWGMWGFATYYYMVLDIRKIKIIESKNNIFLLFLSNLIPKKQLEKIFLLKTKNELIEFNDNKEELYSRYTFFEGDPNNLKKHECIVSNLPYYTCLLQHKENNTSTGVSKKILLLSILEEVNKRMQNVYEKLINSEEYDFDEVSSKGNSIRQIMEYALKYYCLANNIEIKITEKYGHINLGDLKKSINSKKNIISIEQRIVDIANKLSHDSGEVFTKSDIVEFWKDANYIIKKIQDDIITSYNK